MYWPTGSARRLHLTPSGCPPSSSSSSSSLDTENEHQIGHLSRTRSGTYWGSVTASTLYVWSARPAQVIAALTRTKRSLQEYGANTKVWWRPDGANLAVEVRHRSCSLRVAKCTSRRECARVPPAHLVRRRLQERSAFGRIRSERTDAISSAIPTCARRTNPTSSCTRSHPVQHRLQRAPTATRLHRTHQPNHPQANPTLRTQTCSTIPFRARLERVEAPMRKAD